jgi:hypothetical protein
LDEYVKANYGQHQDSAHNGDAATSHEKVGP